MKKTGIFLLVALCLLQCFFLSVQAKENDLVVSGGGLYASVALSGNEDYRCSAEAAILYELDTKALAYAHNIDQSIDPAGLVKLFASLIVLEQGNLDDIVTVAQNTLDALPENAKLIGLQAEEEITLRDLLYCVMVCSADDATAVMTEYMAGSQQDFVGKMNKWAANLGCTATHFENVYGLTGGQHSTARELAVMLDNALENEQFSQMYGAVDYQLPASLSCAQMLVTTNNMMNPDSSDYDPRVTGGKPASVSATEHNLVCTAQTDAGKYLCIILSAGSRSSSYVHYSQAKKLLEFAYKSFSVRQLLGNEQPYGMYEVKDGDNSVVVAPAREVCALLPVKYDASLIQYQDSKKDKKLVAPIEEGTAVGILQITYDSVIVGQVDLVARHAVAEKGTALVKIDTASESGSLLSILKWAVIIIVCIAVFLAAGLITLRQVNIIRHQKRKNARRQKEREEADELE